MGRNRGVVNTGAVLVQVLLLGTILAFSHGGGKAKADSDIQISGTVTNSSGSGVEGVSVYADTAGTNNEVYGPVTTDSNGNYTLYVAPGTYDFYFVSTGNEYSTAVDSNDTVLDNQTVDEQLVPPTYTVSGTVTDQNGNPVSNVVVGLYSADGQGYAGNATTNASGEYSVTLPADTYSLQMSQSYSSNDVDYWNDNTDLDVTGNMTQNLQVDQAQLTVLVEDSNGNPVAGAGIVGQDSSGTVPGVIPGTEGSVGIAVNDQTGSNGSFTMSVPVGTVLTSGSITAYINGTPIQLSSSVTVNGDTTITFEEGQPSTVSQSNPTNLSAPSPTNQSHVLTWTAASGASYYDIYRDGTEVGYSTTPTFTDSGLVEQGTYTYYVTAVNSEGVTSSPSNTITVVYDTTPPTVTVGGVVAGETYPSSNTPTPTCNTTDALSGVATNATLSVTNSGLSRTATCGGAVDNAGNTASPVSVTYTVLPANYTLVNFVDSNGNPLSNTKITIENTASQITTLYTDSFGNAYLNTTPGSYKVTAWYANGYESEEVTVTANGPNNISFTTVPVTVTINDSNANNIANASVAQAGNTGDFGSKVPVNVQGQVTFQVLPGTNSFTAYDANGHEEQSLSVSPTNNAVTFNTYTVQVTVDNGSNNPLTTATVEQAGNSGDYGSKQAVNSQGRITFNVLPGTNYFIAWNGSSDTKDTVNVTADTSVTLVVE